LHRLNIGLGRACLRRLLFGGAMRQVGSIELSRQTVLSLNHQSLFLRIVPLTLFIERSSGFFFSESLPILPILQSTRQ